VRNNDDLAGLRFEGASGMRIEAGEPLAQPDDGATEWQSDRLYLAYPVARENVTIGRLVSGFLLTNLRAESQTFEARLLARENEYLRRAIWYVGGATLLAFALCIAVIWSIARSQARRIRELKIQDEKLSDADFGEPLKILKGDELGDLAEVFNAMRDKLQRTTLSRNYVDRVLASMNEAVIVTNSAGQITRVNEATLRMLNYGESDLIGQPIDLIVDKRKGSSLAIDSPAGVPREAFLLASAPTWWWSATCMPRAGRSRCCPRCGTPGCG
jgi:PAS domain-containing protein